MDSKESEFLRNALMRLRERMAMLETRAMLKPTPTASPSPEVKQLRAQQSDIRRKLAEEKKSQSRAAQQRYWVKTFAAQALPTAMLQVSENAMDQAAVLAADAAFYLWAELEQRLGPQPVENKPKQADDTPNKPQ